MTRLTDWRRSQRWYLLGLLVLAPVTFWLSASEDWTAYASRNRINPIVVAKGATGDYVDATWRLLAINADESMTLRGGQSAPLPQTLSIVRVRLEVTPRTANALEALGRCRGTLTDARGRRWDANPSEIARRAKSLPTDCQEWLNPKTLKTEQAQEGRPWVFELAYLVPRNATGDVIPEITVPQALPRYLRFER